MPRPSLPQELQETKQLANQAMEELLDLARQLRPTALDDHGLVAALRANVRDFDRRGPARASFWAASDISTLPAESQVVVYRVAQEAMNNAARHADAQRIDVSLGHAGAGAVRLQITDDGRGFAVDGAEQRFEHGAGPVRECASERCWSAAP